MILVRDEATRNSILSQSQSKKVPMKVIVVGAGICGVATAVALTQAGHHVRVSVARSRCFNTGSKVLTDNGLQIFEKSRFSGEVGSAVLITPNAYVVLSRLGFRMTRARADTTSYFEVVDGTTLERVGQHGLGHPVAEFGTPLYTVHRADLLNELLRLAESQGLELCLGTRVVAADANEGSVLLEDGTTHQADLIVGADGLHSIMRSVVLGDAGAAAAVPSGLNAFRFLIPTSLLEGDTQFQELLQTKGEGSILFADTTRDTEHHMVWFTCRK